MLSSREVVIRTIKFQRPDRLAYDFPENMALTLYGVVCALLQMLALLMGLMNGGQFGRVKGGFIPRWYTDPEGVGHRPEAIDAMCEEFLKISREIYG